MKSPLRNLEQFRSLSADDRLDFVVAVMSLPVIWAGLRCLGLRRMQALLERRTRSSTGRSVASDARALGEIVATASRHTFGPVTCLTRSLLLTWMLRRRGVHGQLRIGVRLIAGGLSAHAWVEVDGMPIREPADIGSRFLPFADLVPLTAFSTR